jgi:hypothetical protein
MSTYGRYLLSKLAYEGWNEHERQNMFLLIEELLGSNKQSSPKFGRLVLILIQHEILRKGRGDLSKPRAGFQYWNISSLVRDSILPPHEYFGIKFSIQGEEYEKVRLRYQSVEKCRYPEKPYIGVGYKDKGTMQSKDSKAAQEADKQYYENQELRVDRWKADLLDLPTLLMNLEMFDRRVVSI